MANKLEAKKHELSEFNNSTGNKYVDNDGVQPDSINYTIENSEYAVKYSEALANQPDISEVSTEGTPSVTMVDNPDAGIDGAKKFKFSHLKGDKGNPVWVRYAQNNAGLGMTDTPTQDTKYIGFYVGSSAPSDASAITWSKYIGKSPSSVTLEGITFTITYDDGTSDTVQIDTSLCKVTTPITGIVTSVNGQDGAVTIPLNKTWDLIGFFTADQLAEYDEFEIGKTYRVYVQIYSGDPSDEGSSITSLTPIEIYYENSHSFDVIFPPEYAPTQAEDPNPIAFMWKADTSNIRNYYFYHTEKIIYINQTINGSTTAQSFSGNDFSRVRYSLYVEINV